MHYSIVGWGNRGGCSALFWRHKTRHGRIATCLWRLCQRGFGNPTDSRKIAQTTLVLECGYEFEALIRHLLTYYPAQLVQCDYGEKLSMQLLVAIDQCEALKADLINRSAGAIQVKQSLEK